MKQKIRQLFLLISLLIFPLTLYYFSPYVILEGASRGIVSGSFIMFTLLFLFSIFFGRTFCGWICPGGALGEICFSINNKPIKNKFISKIKYIIFIPWILLIIILFIRADGVHQIDPKFATDNWVSVSKPIIFIVYYIVVFSFVILSLIFGRRATCHGVCWMAPFMNLGKTIGKILKIPNLHIEAVNNNCINCNMCTKVCPMSINVTSYIKAKKVDNIDCINCGKCIESCPKKILKFRMSKIKE